VAVEQEMKLPVARLDEVRSRLGRGGGVRRQPECMEDNWTFDDEHGSIRGRGCLLRLRVCGEQATLTFKGGASFLGGVKSRLEIETVVGDAGAARELLGALGYSVKRHYQKRREQWLLHGITIALDTTPMGCFVELEGAPEALPGTALYLQLDPSTALRGSYLELWNSYRSTHPEASPDMVFA
jgi:adenylate cyclase, class 2